ncbi:methyltransferase [Pendulispora brunnea]|uniref:Methyltransferase n=1 Tax=Pendulispora brunnea TaxID=2905690 RepID=A0ABZ2KDC4_9BACT
MAYLLDNKASRELERLEALQAVADPFTIRRLEAIGVREGWRCLEVGGGGGSIARWLCERVGPAGRVVATDIETRFLDALDTPNLEVRRHDITADALETGAFDVVHERSLLEHLREPEPVLRKMVTALVPGGWLLVEDSDYGSFGQVRGGHEGVFTKVSEAFLSLLASGGHDRMRGRKLGCLVREQGLEDVQFESRATEWGGSRPLTPVWALAIEHLRPRMVDAGLVGHGDIDAFLALIRNPDFVGLTACGCAAWGRKPV